MSFSRRTFLQGSAAAAAAGLTGALWQPPKALGAAKAGAFLPTWESLAHYQTPDWFRDAKFGIWAHWGPQCQPGQGDWYARQMYQEGSHDYNYQCEHYGHPSKAGFKDVIHQWKAESWDPEHLIGLYKKAGAKYFMCLANHHDNMDLWGSTHQPWNSVALGPKKNLVGGWEKAARAAGLRFGVSVHAAHAWSWYETSQGADKNGPLTGVPYDGHLTKGDGQGQWWEGLDPQDLYAQAHAPMGLEWDWNNNGRGDLPNAAYIEKFYKRILELIDTYHPDQVYYDDTVLPLYPISDVGLRLASHLYNDSMQRHGGRLEAVVNGKILNAQQRKCMVMDLERGVSNTIEPLPWQTDTCIGNWHYDIDLYHRHGYKTPDQVAHMLLDIVSKNGNLMLNIPLPGSGMPDPDELKFLADFTAWMHVNSEGIYGTRPWKIAVEGPAGSGPATHAQGFNESNRHYTAQDFRFMQKGDHLYAYAMAWPADGKLLVRSLAKGAGRVEDVRLLGAGKVNWAQTVDGLAVTLPSQKPCDYVYGLQIRGRSLTPTPFSDAPLV
nr:alpha-L-fucosidase [Armatimonadota bacterium]